MSYRAYFWLRAILAVGLLVYAANTIYRSAVTPVRTHIWEIVFWSLGPSLWFFAEYFWFDHGWISTPASITKDEFLKGGKSYADYASKIWGGGTRSSLVPL